MWEGLDARTVRLTISAPSQPPKAGLQSATSPAAALSLPSLPPLPLAPVASLPPPSATAPGVAGPGRRGAPASLQPRRSVPTSTHDDVEDEEGGAGGGAGHAKQLRRNAGTGRGSSFYEVRV